LPVLAGYDGVCLVVLLPAGVDHTAVADLEALPPVAQVVQGEVDFATLTDLVCAAVEPSPTLTATGGSQTAFDLPARPVAALGWRAIAVWNVQGGVGRSTIAAVPS
jgi:hypothetical protein